MRRVFCFAITLLTAITIMAASPQLSQGKVDFIRKSMTGLTGEKKLKAYENLVNARKKATWIMKRQDAINASR